MYLNYTRESRLFEATSWAQIVFFASEHGSVPSSEHGGIGAVATGGARDVGGKGTKP